MQAYKQIWQTVAEDIKENIINIVFEPEQRLKETELAEKYGVSKTPIREALRYLAAIGFVEIFPNRMARVRKVKRKEVEDLYDIESVLEGLAVREAVPNLESDHIKSMGKYADLLERSYRERDFYGYEKANISFHTIFWKASDNESLIELIENIRARLQRFRTATRRFPERFRDLVRDHRKITEAAVKRDAEGAERLVRQHFEKNGEIILSLLENEEKL